MKITVEQLARCTGANLVRASARLMAYNSALALYEINTPQRAAMFLANVGHECGGFRFPSEIWGPTDAQRRYERDFTAPWPANAQEANAPEFETNRLAYSLGNAKKGDGLRYRGRGDMETTGLSNYVLLTKRLRARFPQMQVPDFEADPDALLDPKWAALSACDYVAMKGCNAVADLANFDHYCDLVNRGRITARVGDANGYSSRLALWQAACAALGVPT